MSFHGWLRDLSSALAPRREQRHVGRRGSHRAATHRLNLEVLEDRLTPSFSGPLPWDVRSGLAVVWAPPAPLLADFTSDGIYDQISSDWYEVAVRPGRSDGTFGDPIRTQSPSLGPSVGHLLAVADFNGDGRLDAATAGYYDFEDPRGFGSVALGHGNGTFSWFDFYSYEPLLSPSRIGTGDFDGTGRTDVVVAGNDYNGEQLFMVLLNNGDWGTPEPPPPPPPVAPNLRINRVTSVTEGNAGAVSATFTVTLSAASTQAITVNYATRNDNASAGSDYHAVRGTLTFSPGEISKTITVPVIGDRIPEPQERFVVELGGATNATIADYQAVGSIVDDEPRISISDVTRAEGRKGQTTLFTFTVTLSVAYDQPVTMSFRTVNGTAKTSDNDYVARSGTLTFAPGETTKTITIEVKGDSKREANETFYLDLFGNSSNSLFTKNRGIGTILNDD